MEAICWWLDFLAAKRVRFLLIVPNTGTKLLSREADGTQKDFSGALEKRGFVRIALEPKYGKTSGAQAFGLFPTHYHLYALTDSKPGRG